jgi:hypothetical protein
LTLDGPLSTKPNQTTQSIITPLTMQNTFCTDHTPVASHTRQSIAAAAARAAQNAHNGILVGAAARIACRSRVLRPEHLIPPTLVEMRAAIPDHGIMLPEFFQLFLSRVRGESHNAFLVNFKALAAQDPVTELIFAKITPEQASAMQDVNGNAAAPSPKPVVPLTREDIAAAASRAALNMDDRIVMGVGAWRATPSTMPFNRVPPTLDEIRAAIPEDGIMLRDIVRQFHTRLASNHDSVEKFISQVVSVAQQDPRTNLIFLRK